ncbi:peptidase M3 [Corallococcus sp. CA047B]|uniref:peptidase M3 n=1 Tax=Corallococcus sp. CA047B TaxID=2316729 RepID=UPI000EA2FE7C|nr:peptidase M3 [Corallococcus sp. CA047B]RKH03973.1 peptidase M3 [Corallococcus sp. CA047B]
MDRPLHTVRSRLEDFLAELATLQYRYGAGLAPDLPVARLHASFPELSSPETFVAANEALARARLRDDALAVRRITLVRELIATQVEESLAARAGEAVIAAEAHSHIPADDQTLSLAQALAQIPREQNRARRALLESGAGNFLWEHRGAYGDRRDAALQAAELLGFPNYPALRQDVTGIDAGKLAEAAEQTLRATEDAYRDVLGYVLRKLEPNLHALPGGEARRHDVQAALRAPWMDAHFRREDTVPAVMRWLSDWGLRPDAGGRIRLDDEARPGKASRPFVAAVRVPDEIRLVLQPRGGMDALGDLLHELGHAWHLAHVDEDAPTELRRLGDASVTEAYAATFERLLLSPPWLKRYLNLPSGTVKDVIRLAAFQALAVLRRHCAKLSYELSLSTRGASADRADEYADGQRRALFAQPHPGFFLHDVDSQLYVTRYLRAWALETRLTAHLLERFNEDFWRNPAAFAWLKGLFARGGAADAEGLATEVSGTPLALPEAGARLVAILNQ